MAILGRLSWARFSSTLLATGLAAATLGTFSSVAEAQVLRFSKTAAGGIASTGNTLGLAKALNLNGPGTQNSIGTFIALDPNSVDSAPSVAGMPWGKGTTSDWTKNGSSGNLDVPHGAEILYAELVWAGSYNYGGENLATKLETPVTLTVDGDSISVSPDPATALTEASTSMTGFAVNYYMRSGAVTEFVQKHRQALYTVAGVPGTQNEKVNSLNAAGWQLVVAYRDSKLPTLRNLSIFVGGSFVDEDSVQDYTLTGFCAPSSGPVEGRVTVAALEGDADLVGDQLLIGATTNGDFIKLGGVNNPEGNFFCSQINGSDGQVDTTGTFGMANHDAFAGKNVAGGRQGWDTTTLSLSDKAGHLKNDQTEAVIRTITTGDSYMPTMVALELDVKSPDFTSSDTTADKQSVEVGDEFEVTAKLTNVGEAYASAVLFRLPKIEGLDLIGYSTNGKEGDVNGKPVDDAQLPVGVEAGQLMSMKSHTVKLRFAVVGPPADGASEFTFLPAWDHSFVVCAGAKPINDTHTPAGTSVAYLAPMGTGGAGGGGGSGPIVQPLIPIQEEAGCGCTVPGAATPSGGLAALAAVTVLAMRRRRRP